jgi:glycine cleavage system regulatory protein
VKVAVVAEAATVTLAGTVTLLLLLARATVAPPEDAALLNVTVQVLVPAPVNDAGLQERLLTVAVATGAKLRLAVLETLFSVAVTTAV